MEIKKELLDESGKVTVSEGDRIKAYFLNSENNELHFTTKIGSGPAAHSQIYQSRQQIRLSSA